MKRTRFAMMIATVLILLLIVPINISIAEGKIMIDENTRKAADELRSCGYDIPKNIQITASAWRNDMLNQIGDDPFFRAQLTRDEQMRFKLLWDWGAGSYDYETGIWTPTSDIVYAFDAEVYDIDHMYELFLLGVQAIVPEITITDITEDLSQMDGSLEGKRSVSFLCNGHPYQFEFDSLGDWINGEILPLMNQVLEKEHCPYRLCEIQDQYDQMVILIYDTDEKAAFMKQYIDVH